MYVEVMITAAGEKEVGKYEQSFLIAASGRNHHRPGPTNYYYSYKKG